MVYGRVHRSTLQNRWTVSEAPIGMRGDECLRAAWDNKRRQRRHWSVNRCRPVLLRCGLKSWQSGRPFIRGRRLLLVYMWNCTTEGDKRGRRMWALEICGGRFHRVSSYQEAKHIVLCQPLSHVLASHVSDLDRHGASNLWRFYVTLLPRREVGTEPMIRLHL
jgi:hypothetical protein